MAGMMTQISIEKIAGLINTAKFSSDLPLKLDSLRQLKDELCEADPRVVSELISPAIDFHTDRCSPARKLAAELAGDVGLKYAELIPEIIPVLITLLKDCTPAVARQAITCGIKLFRSTFIKVAIKGLYSSDLDDSLKSSWAWLLKYRDEIYTTAFRPESDGRRLLALKFVEGVILLYTPDPTGSSEPPANQTLEGNLNNFNISWLRGGHPILNVGDLSIEASQKLGSLLDQLRFPTIKSLSNLVIIVLIKSLSAIAKKRPAFYGRILPVLLSLDPLSLGSKGLHVSGVHHALKNAFLSCLKCTHPGALPWRDRLVGALRGMKAGGLAEEALHEISQIIGNVEWKDDSSVNEENTQPTEAHLSVKRRSTTHELTDLSEDDKSSEKRPRPTPIVTIEDSAKSSSRDDDDESPSSGIQTSKGAVDNGPVQQLVAMFGALVAQGEKAAASLEILISSISADLLAEVVMANMRHLPLTIPKAEGDEARPIVVGSDTQFNNLSSLFSGIISHSDDYQSTIDATSNDYGKLEVDDQPAVTMPDGDVFSAPSSSMEQAVEPLALPVSDSTVVTSVDSGCLDLQSDISETVTSENVIPGLDSSNQAIGLHETATASSLISSNIEGSIEKHAISFGKSSVDGLPSLSTDRSEELSPKASMTDATSVGLSYQVIIPKMSAPVISLPDEEKDCLQKLAFIRIVEAYKQVAVAGGSQLCFSLLAYLGIEYPLELDPWKLLQTHILSDYVNHEGHELTLRVLYRLFGEAEAGRDFFSSTAATSVYETFLLAVAETLRDSFPASDKSLSRLLNEVPYVPKSILKLLESLCIPGNSDKDEEFHSGERVHQGLSAVWSLILLRPPIRDSSLKIALQSAVHHLEDVRMKAIRLVANRLYPMPSISQQIEDFAKEMLLTGTNVDSTTDKTGVDGSNIELDKDAGQEKPSNECSLSVSASIKDLSSEAGPLSESISSPSINETQRCMSLYFALCTKKNLLFREVFVIYKNLSTAAKKAVHFQVPKLVRAIGSSSQLLEIISDLPVGSKCLLMQVLQTLTDGTIPSPELIRTVRKLYDTKLKDAEILIPLLPFLPKDEVLWIFPHLLTLEQDKFQVALARALQGSVQLGPVLTPAEVLIAIHGIDPDRDGIPLKKITDACNTCFEQRQLFNQQVIAKVLNQLVEQIPLPMLFMRTVLQAIGAFPSLVDFIMEILSRLVNKQIWKYPKLWVGFLKCALLTKPQSFSVLLQLPPAQLENALNRTAALKAPLVAHACQPDIRASLPRSVLVVLGIASDSQSASQGPTTQPQAEDAGNSEKDGETEGLKEELSAS